MYIFNSLKLILAGQEVEHVSYPGLLVMLLGLKSYSSDYQSGWYKVGSQILVLLQNAGFKTRQGYLIDSQSKM